MAHFCDPELARPEKILMDRRVLNSAKLAYQTYKIRLEAYAREAERKATHQAIRCTKEIRCLGRSCGTNNDRGINKQSLKTN